MKKRIIERSALEPGLLNAFKSFVGIRFIFTLLSNGLRSGMGEGERLSIVFLFILGETILMLAYLFSKRMQGVLGRLYLPFGLTLLTLFPLFEMLVRNQEILLRGNAVEAQVPVMTLLVVVILIAWQYSLVTMLSYCLLSGIILYTLSLPIIRSGQLSASVAAYTAFSTVVFLAIVGFVVNSLVATQRQQRAEVARVNAELRRQAEIREQLAATRERNRLAGELHDVLAHAFSALTVELEAVRSLWVDDPQRAHHMLKSALQTANNGLEEARRAVRSIRAAPLIAYGLAIAVQNMAVDAADRAGLLLVNNISGDFTDIHPDIEQCVYRVAGEAISNTLQHANAKNLRVDLFRERDCIILEVRDDGVGLQGEPAVANGFGLQGMRARARQLGGSCEIHSIPDQGTTVHLNLPLEVK